MPQDWPPFEEFEHAADAGLRARGRSLEELFANAALGMLQMMGTPGGTAAEEETAIDIDGLDSEHLLVRWLSEILYLYREGRAAAGFEFEHLDERKLRARCRLSDLPGGHVPIKEIKLVTHHGAAIRKKDGLLEAEVVFDV